MNFVIASLDLVVFFHVLDFNVKALMIFRLL